MDKKSRNDLRALLVRLYGTPEEQCGGVPPEEHWLTRDRPQPGAAVESLPPEQQELLELIRPYLMDRLEKRLLAKTGGTKQ